MKSLAVARSFVIVVATAFCAAMPSSLAYAHGAQEVSATQRVEAKRSSLEATVRTVTVVDDVTGTSHAYKLLDSADGVVRLARGAGAAALLDGARYDVSGVVQGRSIEVESTVRLPVQSAKSMALTASATVGGTLRLGHMDFENGRGEYFFAVFAADGYQWRLAGAELIDELRNGMEVEAIGVSLDASTVEVRQILIRRHPPVVPKSELQSKAVATHSLFIVPVLFPATAGVYPAEPFTVASLNTAVFAPPPSSSVVAYYKEVSYGQQLLTGVTANASSGWLHAASVPPLDSKGNKQCDINLIQSQGQSAALAAGYTSAQVTPGFMTPGSTANANHVVYVFNQASFNCGWSGLAYIGYGLAFVKQTTSLLVIGHELGHTFGLEHAGSLSCGSNPIGGTCKVTEYGDPFDVMGNIASMHFSAFQKNLLAWIADAAVTTHAAGSATYTLAPLESPGGSRYALRVPASANRTYWIEYRQPVGFDSGISVSTGDGAQIRVARPTETVCSTCDAFSDDTELLDMAPATTTFTDATLRSGGRFVDAYYGVVIEVLSRTASALTVRVTMLAKAASPDFDASSSTDLVWRNTSTGATAVWLMNGATPASMGTVSTDASWKVIRNADFNGDDKSDLLWQNDATGQTAIWLMNGLGATTSAIVFTDPKWRVQTTGDFDGDGKADLLWYNAATGQTAIWLMNGLASKSVAVIWPDASWKVVATGDFNGDGRTDLVWRNSTTGAVAIWLMNGLTNVGATVIWSDPQWLVTLVGDFDGDGKSDLIWRHAITGRTAVWLMNGTTGAGSAYLTPDGTWEAKAVGDFDGDGKADILWRSSAGATEVTLMNGMTAATTSIISTAGSMEVLKLGDFNGDGMSDILWQNTSSAQTSVWLMNGATMTGSATLPAQTGWSAMTN